MSKMECPVCGEKFDTELVEYLENGNPACPTRVDNERKMDIHNEQKTSEVLL